MKIFLTLFVIQFLFKIVFAQDLIWEKTTEFTSNPIVHIISMENNEIFAGTKSDGLYKSKDGGNSWSKIISSFIPNITAMSKDQSGSLIISTGLGDLLKTTDEGLSWNKIKNFNSVSDFIIRGNNIYVAAGDSGLYYSNNNGIDWISLTDSLTANSVTLNSDSHIFLSTNDKGIYESKDSGKIWNQINDIPTTLYFKLYKLNSSNNILAGDATGNIYLYDNDNFKWKNVLKDDSTSHPILDFIQTDNNYVFAASLGNGVYSSKDSGLTWTRLNNGLTDSNVTSLTFDTLGFLYAGATSVIFKAFEPGLPEKVKLIYPKDSTSIKSNIIRLSWFKSNYNVTDYRLELSTDSLFNS